MLARESSASRSTFHALKQAEFTAATSVEQPARVTARDTRISRLTKLEPPRMSQEVSMLEKVDEDTLSRAQKVARCILMNRWFQLTMTIIIVTHMMLTVQQTDQHARNEKLQLWQALLEKFFLVMYLIDILLRLYTLRKAFFLEKMNMFDLFIVAVDTMVTFLDTVSSGNFDIGPISVLRALRALRIVRVIRNLASFRDLYLMLKGMEGAMRAIFFAFLLIFVVLTMFSIAAVEMIHPLNQRLAAEGTYPGCDWCARAFSSVMDANLTFFSSILAGDSWGKLAIPLIEANPAVTVIILSVFVVLEFGLINVIIAVVVDRQAQAREDDKDLQHTVKEEQAAASYKELVTLFETMDADGSGSLSVTELCESFTKFADFRKILETMDVSVDDLATIFSSMDRDGGGTVDYQEFVNELHKMRTMEVRILVYLTRQHVIEVKEALKTLTDHVLGEKQANLPFSNQISASNSDPSPTLEVAASAKPLPFPVSKALQDDSASDERLRLAQLECQFATLESKVAETARASQERINKLGSMTGSNGTQELDVSSSTLMKIKAGRAGDSFSDELVPELMPSSSATPGRDLHNDGSPATPNSNQLLAGNGYTVSLSDPWI